MQVFKKANFKKYFTAALALTVYSCLPLHSHTETLPKNEEKSANNTDNEKVHKNPLKNTEKYHQMVGFVERIKKTLPHYTLAEIIKRINGHETNKEKENESSGISELVEDLRRDGFVLYIFEEKPNSPQGSIIAASSDQEIVSNPDYIPTDVKTNKHINEIAIHKLQEAKGKGKDHAFVEYVVVKPNQDPFGQKLEESWYGIALDRESFDPSNNHPVKCFVLIVAKED